MFEQRFANDFEGTESPADRRSFVKKVYMEFLIYVLLGILHWVLAVTILNSTCNQLVKDHGSTFILLFLLSIFLFIIFALTDQISELPFLGCFVVFMIVECLNLSLLVVVEKLTPVHLMISILTVVTVVLILCVLGSLIPYDITNSVNLLIMIGCCALLISIYAIMYYVTLKITWPIFSFAGVIAGLVLCFLVYHVQCIAGDGNVQAALGDDKYAALLLYHDFLALFMLTLYWQ